MPVWQKSSFSNANSSGGCVEVAALSDGEMAVRDTKDRARPAHHHSAPAWRAFLAAVRRREFETSTP